MKFLFIGSYDGILKVYEFVSSSSLLLIYSFKCHSSTIKSLAGKGDLLCSGSTDETIQLFNLSTGRATGSLLESIGSVNCLSLHHCSHLLSGTEDGSVNIWRTKDWERLRTLKGHRGAVECIDVHQSGRIAITSGRDKTIRLWDLMRGTCAMTMQSVTAPIALQWSPNGSYYVILNPLKLTVCRSGSEEYNTVDVHGNAPFTAMCFVLNNLIIVGLSDGTLVSYIIEEEAEAPMGWSVKYKHRFEGEHQNRVKGISPLEVQNLGGDTVELIFVSGDTTGVLHLWKLEISSKSTEVEEENISPFLKEESNIHLTTLTTNYNFHRFPTTTDDIIDLNTTHQAVENPPKQKKMKQKIKSPKKSFKKKKGVTKKLTNQQLNSSNIKTSKNQNFKKSKLQKIKTSKNQNFKINSSRI